MTTAMDALLKVAIEGLDEDIVPKITKTTTEETTSFVCLDSDQEKVDDAKRKSQDEPTSKVKKAKMVSTLDEKVEEAVEGPERNDGSKEGHPEQKRLPNEMEEPNAEEDEWNEPYHHPYEGFRDTYGYGRYQPPRLGELCGICRWAREKSTDNHKQQHMFVRELPPATFTQKNPHTK